MGLDMYLQARLFASQHYDPGKVYDELKATRVPWPKPPDSFVIEGKLAYWRKANQIHQWFINNCGEGNSDERTMFVSLEQLTELRDLCAKLLKSRDVEEAKEELPTQEGFFFGGTDYDDSYWQDLEDTVEQLSKIIGHPTSEMFDYEYQASW